LHYSIEKLGDARKSEPGMVNFGADSLEAALAEFSEDLEIKRLDELDQVVEALPFLRELLLRIKRHASKEVVLDAFELEAYLVAVQHRFEMLATLAKNLDEEALRGCTSGGTHISS